jgi:hypothetical protein
LAIETARALEARGDMSNAAKWLRRAAREADNQGDDARVLELARVAADMASAIPTDVATETLGVESQERPDSSMKTVPDDDDSSTPTMVPPRPAREQAENSRVPAPSPSIPLVCGFSISLDQTASEATMRVGAVRVAIKRTTSTSKCFSVEALDPGQNPPAGSIEAMLILPGDVVGTQESTIKPVGKGAPPRR